MPILLLVLLVAGASPARAGSVAGVWQGPLGLLQVDAKGTALSAKVLVPSPGAGVKAGQRVLEGTLADDTATVKVKLPITGCKKPPKVASGLLILAMNDNLFTGALHPGTGCSSPLLGKNGGFVIRRVPADLVAEEREEALALLGNSRGPPLPREKKPAAPKVKAASPAAAGDAGVVAASAALRPLGEEKAVLVDPGLREIERGKARAVIREGAAYLSDGRFEKAREKFLEAIDVDPTVAEAYNGVGVSHYGRGEHSEAMAWYRRALAVDPDFGDAYYNIACLHALANRADAAFKFLSLAVKNGYTTLETLDRDPDLDLIRKDPRFAKIRKGKG